ncbi:aminotransferase class V-fold PLP-dependent enzyme [candidate division KSB1 bacterium]
MPQAHSVETVQKPIIDKKPLDAAKIARDFPILNRTIHGKRLVYLDSAATSQKPLTVINALSSFYKTSNANIHRGIHTLSEESSNAYEFLRDTVADYIGGVDRSGVVFTRNTTESINLAARSWGSLNIKSGDEILITEMEHHSNLLPWMMLARSQEAHLKYVRVTDEGYLDMESFRENLTGRTKLVAVTMVSNVLGTINPIGEIIDEAHRQGSLVLIDGAQGLPHKSINARSLDCDFLAFSAHKMLGPTGIGVLYAKPEILEAMNPYQVGGGMISDVSYDDVAWAEIPYKFEAGTPNYADCAAFTAALEYLKKIGMDAVLDHEKALTEYALEKLSHFKDLRLLGPREVDNRAGVVTWHDKNIHAHDLSTILDMEGIAIRAGHHCVQPLLKKYGIPSTARASFYIYNTKDDVDALIDGLHYARRYLGYE